MKRRWKQILLFTLIFPIASVVLYCSSDSDILTGNSFDSILPIIYGDLVDPTAVETVEETVTATLEQRLNGIWVFGGTSDGSDFIAEVDLYDPVSDTWFEDVTTFPVARTNFAIASGLGKIYIIGGTGLVGIVNRVDIFDPESLTWSSASTVPQTQVRGAGLVYSRGRFFLMGGYVQGTGITQQYYTYTPADDTWANTGRTISQTREDLAYCNCMDAAFGIGGRSGNTVRNYNRYNHTTYNYLAVARTALLVYTTGATCHSVGQNIYLVGGTTSNTTLDGRATLYIYDNLLNNWGSKAAMSQGRYYHGSALVNDNIYVFGGTTNGSAGLDSVEAYNVVNDNWSARTSMPRVRFSHGATKVVIQ